jgi:hypothetical protein
MESASLAVPIVPPFDIATLPTIVAPDASSVKGTTAEPFTNVVNVSLPSSVVFVTSAAIPCICANSVCVPPESLAINEISPATSLSAGLALSDQILKLD